MDSVEDSAIVELFLLRDERAIAFSDAYYGDQSSVVELYKKTGKPIMIQNVDILQNKVKNRTD